MFHTETRTKKVNNILTQISILKNVHIHEKLFRLPENHPPDIITEFPIYFCINVKPKNSKK